MSAARFDLPDENQEVYDPTNISITGLDPASVLVALFDASKITTSVYQGENLSQEEARSILKQHGTNTIHYIKGKLIKSYIEGDVLNARLFDRDNGEDSAGRIIQRLRVANV